MDIKRNFGNKLREIRVRKGLTQEKLSECIGIQPENYSRIENGLAFPKPENITKISEVLGIEVAELFQFSTLEASDDILNLVVEKLKNDKEILFIIYKFLQSMGKL